MFEKLKTLGIIWAMVVFAYILMAFLMPFYNQIFSDTATALESSANMSRMPGTLEAVESAPVWWWFIPAPVGIVASAIVLKRG